MFEKLKSVLTRDKNHRIGIFSESPLKTSFYEELQKNGWCDIIDDQPDDLTKLIRIAVKKTIQINNYHP